MGNTETNDKKQNRKSILISHPAFGNAQIVRNSNGKQLVEIGISMKSEKDFLTWEKNYKRIPKVNAVLYPEDIKYENKGCCGSSGIAHIQYQRYPYVLAEQINLRRNNNQGHFSENQLWLLLYSLVSSGQMFHLRKLKIGDVRPENVFLNSEGEIKVASQFTYPYGATNYEKTLTNREIVTYLAPQQVKDIQFGKMKDLNEPLIVQTFSIGLTVLDTAVLSSSQKFYDGNGQFNYNKLSENLKLLNHIKYSPHLTYIIQKMLELQPANRLRSAQVLKLLRPFQNQILAKKPFNPKIVSSNYQNPEQNINDISRISINQNERVRKQGDFKFVPGVVFDSKDDSMMLSSFKHSKQVVVRTSKVPNTYKIPQGQKMTELNTPVQTTIHYPPITISLPQPIYEHNGPQHNN